MTDDVPESPTVTEYVSATKRPYYDDPRGWYRDYVCAVQFPQAVRSLGELLVQAE